MVRHSPCKKYIEHLLVHPDGYTDDSIVQILRQKQLDFISTTYLERLRAELIPPDPFRPYDETHLPSKRFITAKGLYYLYFPDEATRKAVQVLEEPRAKELMETMLITFDPPALIAQRLSKLWKPCSLEVPKRYKFFFFDMDMVDSTELNAILALRADFVHRDSNHEDDQVRGAVKMVAYSDPRRVMARYPNTEMAGVLNAMRMGYMPNRMELSRVLQATRVGATLRANALVMHGTGLKSAEEAQAWASVAKISNEMLNDVGSPDADLQRELQTLALATDTSTVPYIGRLSGGSHTVDLQPIDTEGVHTYVE